MQEMHWSWAELQATPLYVRACCAVFLSEEAAYRRKQQEQQDQSGY